MIFESIEFIIGVISALAFFIVIMLPIAYWIHKRVLKKIINSVPEELQKEVIENANKKKTIAEEEVRELGEPETKTGDTLSTTEGEIEQLKRELEG